MKYVMSNALVFERLTPDTDSPLARQAAAILMYYLFRRRLREDKIQRYAGGMGAFGEHGIVCNKAGSVYGVVTYRQYSDTSTVEIKEVVAAVKGRGVGKRLMCGVADIAAEAGLTKVRVVSVLQSARGFYEHLGLLPTEEPGTMGGSVAGLLKACQASDEVETSEQ